MPISFAEALKKKSAPKPEPAVAKKPPRTHEQQKSPPPNKKNNTKWPEASKPKDKKSDNNSTKRPTKHRPTTNAPQASKKPKPSSSARTITAIATKPQSAPSLVEQEFPSLGAVSKKQELKQAPTIKWGKSTAATKPPTVVAPSVKSKSKPPKSKPSKSSTKTSGDKKASAAASLLRSFGAKQRSEAETSQMGVFLKQTSGEAPAKGLQRLGPKRKKFSTLKKRVLAERVEQYQQEQNIASCTTRTVMVSKYCSPEELDSEGELLHSNLIVMVQKMKEDDSVKREDCFISPETGNAYVHLASVRDAHRAVSCWNGLVVLGGSKLHAELFDVSETTNDWKQAVQKCEQNEKEVSNTQPLPSSDAKNTHVILENVLTQDDLDDADCLEESIQDVRQLLASATNAGDIVDVRVHPDHALELVATLSTSRSTQMVLQYFASGNVLMGGQVVRAVPMSQTSNAGIVHVKNFLTQDDLDDADCLDESLADLKNVASQYGPIVEDLVVSDRVVVITYKSQSIAITAARELDQKVLGGEPIHALALTNAASSSSTSSIILKNILTEDDLEDEDCMEETKSDIAELAGNVGTVIRILVDTNAQTVQVDYKDGAGVSSRAAADAAVQKFHGMVMGGQTIAATLLTTSDSNMDVDDVAKTETVNVAVKPPEEPKEMYSGDKLIPDRFAEMKRTPKVPNAGQPRPYASLLKDDTIQPLLQEMLGELMRLQKRAVQEQNTKAKRRLVMGLREVSRGIRSHKVKLVVMANNLDNYGAIDEKLQEIIDLARQESVPIFYEFNKRRLGKAIGKSIKIGVIGVQNVEGAHPQFKKLISLANKYGAY